MKGKPYEEHTKRSARVYLALHRRLSQLGLLLAPARRGCQANGSG